MNNIILTPEQTFTARAGDHLVHGLRETSTWEGLRKLVDNAGRHIIIKADGSVVDATPALLHDLNLTVLADDGYIQMPATTLPNGHIEPAFKVAARPCSEGDDGAPLVDGKAKPRVNMSYRKAKDWLLGAGLKMLTAAQGLAIAINIASVDENWTGGKVGEGEIYRGLYRGTVSGAQAADYVSPHENERRWHKLTTGAIIWDFSGNVFCWMHDNLHGDEEGLVKGSIPADSMLLTSAPAPSQTKGVGYIPSGPLSWNGRALVRGGCWSSGGDAGVFLVSGDWPDYGVSDVGVRSTK